MEHNARHWDLVRRGLIGDLHCICAQWHRDNLPEKDSWKQPIPKNAKRDDALSEKLLDLMRIMQLVKTQTFHTELVINTKFLELKGW